MHFADPGPWAPGRPSRGARDGEAGWPRARVEARRRRRVRGGCPCGFECGGTAPQAPLVDPGALARCIPRAVLRSGLGLSSTFMRKFASLSEQALPGRGSQERAAPPAAAVAPHARAADLVRRVVRLFVTRSTLTLIAQLKQCRGSAPEDCVGSDTPRRLRQDAEGEADRAFSRQRLASPRARTAP